METAVPNPSETKDQLVDLNLIDLPADARTHDPAAISSLAQDMAKNRQLQEIILMPQDKRYEVVAGVGRVLAARQLGWKQIKAQLREGLSDFQKAAITFSENEHREDADPFYQAYQLEKMRKDRSCTQRELGAAVGLAENRISEYLSIASLNPEVRKNFQRWKFSKSDVVELMRLKTPEEQIRLGQRCQKEGLSLRALHALVDEKLDRGDKPRAIFQKEIGIPGPDPAAKLWKKIEAGTAGWAWSQEYRDELTWQFTVDLGAMTGFDIEKVIGQWFFAMAAASGETKLDAEISEQLAQLKDHVQKTRNMVEEAIEASEKGDEAATQVFNNIFLQGYKDLADSLKTSPGEDSNSTVADPAPKTTAKVERPGPKKDSARPLIPSSGREADEAPLDPKIAEMVARQIAKGRIS